MKKLFCFLLLAASLSAQAKVNIFACEPEWQALAKELGGEKVKTFSATTAFQDPHHIEARPSLIAKTRRADLVVCTGSELEIGWLPVLVRQSGNKRIQQDQPGYFMASEFVERLEIPEELDRKHGDIHAGGNPHVHLDPKRLLTIAEKLSQRLQVIDSENKQFYQDRLSDFTQSWDHKVMEWSTSASLLKDMKVIIYHRNWTYLLDWLGIEAVGDLEPKPGLPPTSSHLVSLLKTVEEKKPTLILLAEYQDDKGAKWLANKTDLKIVKLPFTIGGNKQSTDLFNLYENTLQLLINANKNG